MTRKPLILMLTALVVLVGLGLGSHYLNQSSQPQETDPVAKVGVLQFVTHEALDEIYRGIKDGLSEAGYDEGENLELNFLNSEADQSKVQTMSQTLVQQGNEVLVGIATPAAQGLASATSELPIVMGAVTDPVGANLVQNLDAPEGNVTGVSDRTPIGDQLALMAELTPDVKTLGVIYSSSEDNSKAQVEDFTKQAEAAGYTVKPFAVASTNDITTTANVMLGQVDAVWVPLDNTLASAFTSLVQAAQTAQKPIYPSVDTMVAGGGLASVYIDQYQLGVTTGQLVAKVLAGKPVAKLPVEIIDQGKPVINQTVADSLGISIPDSLKETAQLLD